MIERALRCDLISESRVDFLGGYDLGILEENLNRLWFSCWSLIYL